MKECSQQTSFSNLLYCTFFYTYNTNYIRAEAWWLPWHHYDVTSMWIQLYWTVQRLEHWHQLQYPHLRYASKFPFHCKLTPLKRWGVTCVRLLHNRRNSNARVFPGVFKITAASFFGQASVYTVAYFCHLISLLQACHKRSWKWSTPLTLSRE